MSETILKHASKTALTLIAFALVFTALLVYVFNLTEAPIEQAEAKARLSLFGQIIPPNTHDNDLLKDAITIAPAALQIGRAHV